MLAAFLAVVFASACSERHNDYVFGLGGGGKGPDSLPPTVTFTAISAGGRHTCGLDEGGVAWCWGDNDNGQLGNGTTADAARPRQVASSGATFSAISAGMEHTCALDAAGAAWCWGRNTSGRLGTGTSSGALVPTRVAVDFNWRSISAGIEHSCGISETGAAWCWGRNVEGQLGTGDFISTEAPARVNTNAAMETVDAGDRFSCGLVSGGQAFCWGSNALTAPRLGSEGGDTPLPRAVAGTTTFATLGIGAAHGCGIERGASRVSCWGSATIAGGIEERRSPARIALDADVGTLDVGSVSSCVLTLLGRAWCWGVNGSGQLGNGSFTPSAVPVAVTTTVTFASISVGARHACALTARREAWCWGENGSGELGLGTMSAAPATTPRRLP